MTETNDDVWRQADALAKDLGVEVILGVRPAKGWFANVVMFDEPIEWDGSTPGEALGSVIETIRERAIQLASTAEASQRRSDQVLSVLDRVDSKDSA